MGRVLSRAEPDWITDHPTVGIVVAGFVDQRRLDGGRGANGELPARRIRARGRNPRQGGSSEQAPGLDRRNAVVLKAPHQSQLRAEDVIHLDNFLPQIKDVLPDERSVQPGAIRFAQSGQRQLGIDVLDIRSGRGIELRRRDRV